PGQDEAGPEPLGDEGVAVTDATGVDADADLAASRLGQRPLFADDRLSGGADDHRLHGLLTPPASLTPCARSTIAAVSTADDGAVMGAGAFEGGGKRRARRRG